MKIFPVLMGALLIGGCASLPPQELASSSTNASPNDSPLTCDYDHMARIDHAARVQGTNVKWFHCPQLSRDKAKTVS